MFSWGAGSISANPGVAPNIPSFYRGQHILVTGATGYLGKAVVEKLLRCCSDLGKITVILRQKKDKDPQKRLQEYLNDMVFERVKREKPGVINKVDVVSGDLMAIDLGISPEERQLLEENVSVIFHSAASVRFDDPLKKALAVNTRGTLEMVKLAQKMRNLKVLVHVSTAYCNCDKYEIDEVIYPPSCDWQTLLSAMDHVDDHTFNILTSKILGTLPNTYTFSKRLAENVVRDVAKDLPVVILRPTIILPALEEPFPGWVDNFNGPVGLIIAGGLGLVSMAYADPDVKHNYVPVDQVTNALLVAAWETAVFRNDRSPTVINVARSLSTSNSLLQLLSDGIEMVADYPCGYSLWTVKTTLTCNIYRYYFSVVFLHFLLGCCLDRILKWFHPSRVSLVSLYRKIHHANLSIGHFAQNEWDFKNHKMHWLRKSILPEDRKIFDFERFEEPINAHYAKLFILGGRRFLLRQHDNSIPDHLAHAKRVLWIVRIYYLLLSLCLCWAVYYLFFNDSAQDDTYASFLTVQTII